MNFSFLKEPGLWLQALWEHHRTIRSTREKLEAMQMKKFRRMAAFAQKHSPYYRDLMARQGIDAATCVPQDFPVLTKRDVIEHFDEIVTDRRITRKRISDFLARSTDPGELFEGEFHVLHTSGTSGTVGYYVFSPEAWVRGASHVVRVSPLRVRKRTAFVAATKGHFAGASLMLTGNRGSNALFFDVRTFDVGRPMPGIIAELNKFQPHALCGYGAVLKVLAEAQERGDLCIKPTHVGNGGEPLLPEVQALLERVFKTHVSNAYASSEHLYMGITLPGSDGMHLMEDDLIFELHDDHTCVTNLFNKVMPLIRYRMDDVLIPDRDTPSKYPFTKIKNIVGRSEDALVFTNRHGEKDFIHPIVIVELIIAGLNAWQIVLEGDTSFRFRAKFEEGQTEEEEQETRERISKAMDALLTEKAMENVSFTIEKVEKLNIDPHSGKFRLVVREAPERMLARAQ